jgi:hypothetical protein
MKFPEEEDGIRANEKAVITRDRYNRRPIITDFWFCPIGEHPHQDKGN